MKNLIEGIKAKGFKVLANRAARALNCTTHENDTFVREISLFDKDNGEFVCSIPQVGNITGITGLEVNFTSDGYEIRDNAPYACSRSVFH
ncbi:MAG: hypothetical protein GY870_04960 [archaeon]|nr:hypothetical protein [archaeon]